MKTIGEIVIEQHNRLLQEKHIDKQSSPEMEIRPRNGITSESIVNLLLGIEDCLDIDLDDYLPEIRKCKTIKELIVVIEQAYEAYNK